MKTYEQIEEELVKLQESYRHPDAKLKMPPYQEGQIAVISVQFLFKELKEQIELRDRAAGAAQTSQKAAVAMAEVMNVHGLDSKPWDWAVEKPEELPSVHPEDKPPVPRSIYNDAIARIERLEARLTAESKTVDSLYDKVSLKEREITDLKEQMTVTRYAALAMFQKMKAAAHVAKNATGPQAARYLMDAVNFHLNGALEEVKRLNAEQERQEEAKKHKHITHGEKPR